jgi:error-prone DNA polymerase
LVTLAEIGALNFDVGVGDGVGVADGGKHAAAKKRRRFHRRDALWQVERVARAAGPLLEDSSREDAAVPALLAATESPLAPMTDSERLIADFRGTGMTVGPHPMAYCRAEMNQLGVRRANELEHLRDGMRVRIAGAVICRQRPGTAKGFVFLSIEDETGIANAIITPDLFAENRVMVVNNPFLLVEGKLQHQDNVISVKVETVEPLRLPSAAAASHDFH